MRISDWSSDVCSSDLDGASCDSALAAAVEDAIREQSVVVNGRFKGGWITRHYGRPEHGVHAIQMELAIRGYADETVPDRWDADRAAPMQATLCAVLRAALDFAKRSEEHTSELQSLMRTSYAVFCLKKKKQSPISLK